MSIRPRLTPAIADVRRAVREALAAVMPVDADAESRAAADPLRQFVTPAPVRRRQTVTNGRNQRRAPGGAGGKDVQTLVEGGANADVLVALSGGADSLALAAATAFEAGRAGIRAGVVVVDHGLQAGSAEVAKRAAGQARELGLDPVIVTAVTVGTAGGPEAAARLARYAALDEAASQVGARVVLLGHTLDDQAETVLLGLARGSGAASLSGMAVLAPSRADDGGEAVGGVTYVRPLLGIRRSQTEQFCADSGLEPWHDPQNGDPAFQRVRVRETVLPLLERELGPGVVDALARTAEQLREDAEALDHFAAEQVEELAEHAEAGISLSVRGLAANPAALLQRIIRSAVLAEFGVSLSRAQTLATARLVTDWHGQKAVSLPGVRVVRHGGLLVFSADDAARGHGPATKDPV